MRIPLSWLAEHVDLGADATLESVHAALVKVGFEEEDTHTFDLTGPIVIGEVLSREPEQHSNGKTVNWCQVRVAPEGEQAADGGADVRGIVCGAHNFEVGDKVIATLPGAVLPGGFAIAARKTYGHVSDGMLASARELGVGEDHDGIIVLRNLGLDAPVGTNALELLGLTDAAVEINVTPDRGYALSIRGVAREYANATGAKFVDPVPALAATAAAVNLQDFDLQLSDAAPLRGNPGARGFVVRLVTGVDATRPTPSWMVSRLALAGQRSVGLIADITNYVMLELGNPLHAYDAAKVQGGITVRRAAAGEQLVTLDGVTRDLHPEDLVIADSSSVLALAGVMGSEHSKTTAATTDVLLEAATFDPVTVARSTRRHKLPSEASKRFARYVDPLLAAAAAQRAVELLVELGGGTATAVGAAMPAEYQPAPVILPKHYIAGLVGVAYTDEQVVTALTKIGCEVSDEGDSFAVTAPSWHADLTRPADLAEEVARICGFDLIPSQLPVAPSGRGLTREQLLRRKAANTVTAQGLTEVQNYPFSTQQQISSCDSEPLTAASAATARETAVKLANALDAKAAYMRKALLPGLLVCASRNTARGMQDLALVEFGTVWLAQQPLAELGTDSTPPIATSLTAAQVAELNASLPAQPRHAAALLTGAATPVGVGQTARNYDWADALAAAQNLARAVGAELTVTQGQHPAFHPGRCARLTIADELLGYAGELAPELVAAHHLPHRVAAYELDLDRLLELAPRAAQVSGISTYPAATQDVTLLVAADTPAAAIATSFTAGAGELLEDMQLVADYRGEGVAAGEKALTFALRFRAADRTLTAAEANEAKLAGVTAATAATGARIRD